jgi:hypothetical protein
MREFETDFPSSLCNLREKELRDCWWEEWGDQLREEE